MSLNKILLVDDSPPSNFLNKIILKENDVNCLVDEVYDGEMALNYLIKSGECPDVILLDLNMPVMDGFTFLDEYNRNDNFCDETKVFVLSSSIADEDRAETSKYSNVKGYFEKPLTEAHIQSILSLFQ
jgi:CheY-like chemotaxis protein